MKVSDLLIWQTQNLPVLFDSISALRNSIYSNPGKQWRIDDVAKEFLISKLYLQHLYKSFFNTNIKSDIKKSKIEYSQ